MTELLLILLGAGLVNNLALDQLIGVCPGVALSRKIEVALGFGLVTTLVLTAAAAIGALVLVHVLQPLELMYLRLPVFALLIIAFTTAAAHFVSRQRPALHARYSVYIPLTLVNCSSVGVTLLIAEHPRGLAAALFFGLGAGLGLALVAVVIAALRERIAAADVPAAFRGNAILLLTLGFLSMAFTGFTGLTDP